MQQLFWAGHSCVTIQWVNWRVTERLSKLKQEEFFFLLEVKDSTQFKQRVRGRNSEIQDCPGWFISSGMRWCAHKDVVFALLCFKQLNNIMKNAWAKRTRICLLVNCCACCTICVSMWPTVLAYKSSNTENKQAYLMQQPKICQPNLAKTMWASLEECWFRLQVLRLGWPTIWLYWGQEEELVDKGVDLSVGCLI